MTSDTSTPTSTTPATPLDLHGAAQEVLRQAQGADAGRAAHNLTPGRGAPLAQTLLGLRAGAALQDHVAPGPATLQVLLGAGRLTYDGQELELPPGSWAPIPDARHGLIADQDLVVLLTVAPRG